MAATTVFATLDYLLTTFRGLAALAPPAAVYDGIPEPGDNEADLHVTVGGEVEPTTDTTLAWASIGNGGKEEDYVIRCYIKSFVGTDSDVGQKQARDAAKTVYVAVDAAIRGDKTLGGNVRIAELAAFQMDQSNDADASNGRRCDIHFAVHCAARI